MVQQKRMNTILVFTLLMLLLTAFLTLVDATSATMFSSVQPVEIEEE